MEQLDLGGEHVLEDSRRIAPQILETAAEPQGRGGPCSHRLAQLRFERRKAGVPERLRRADHRRVAGVQPSRDLDRRKEHHLLAVLCEESGDALLGWAQVGSHGGDAFFQRRVLGGPDRRSVHCHPARGL